MTFTRSTDGCVSGDWSFVAFDSNGQPTALDLCPSGCEKCSTEGASIHIAFTCLPD